MKSLVTAIFALVAFVGIAAEKQFAPGSIKLAEHKSIASDEAYNLSDILFLGNIYYKTGVQYFKTCYVELDISDMEMETLQNLNMAITKLHESKTLFNSLDPSIGAMKIDICKGGTGDVIYDLSNDMFKTVYSGLENIPMANFLSEGGYNISFDDSISWSGEKYITLRMSLDQSIVPLVDSNTVQGAGFGFGSSYAKYITLNVKSLDSNIPEPSSFALILGMLVLSMSIIYHRKK